MPVGPYSQDVLTRIYNVHWGSAGSVFVSGDQWGFGRHATMKEQTSEQDWIGLDKLATASVEGEENDEGQIVGLVNGFISGSSYAVAGGDQDRGIIGKPTFVLAGGTVVHTGGPLESHAIIMASLDGLNWTTVFDRVTVLLEGVSGMSVGALVWDKDANAGNGSFYAMVFEEGDEVTYQSTTGLSWGPGGGAFSAHCNGKLPGVPDGQYGYDEANDILIEPSHDGVKITTGKDTPDEKTTNVTLDFIGVFCVAFAGGIWEAGGNTVLAGPLNTACTATSIDDGQTWTMVSKGALGMHEETGQAPSIWTIVAAPASDFSG